MDLKLGDIAQDVAAETGGVWKASPWGGEFLIGREGNSAFRKAVFEAAQPARATGREVTPDEWNEISLTAMSRTVLLGWRGIVGADGTALDYTPETARQILADETLRDLRDWIFEQSKNAAAYRLKARKAAEGN